MITATVPSALSPFRFIRALFRQPVDRTPIWLMRQAGRYLPEYRAVRAKAGEFMSLCKTPTLAAEVTLQPLARFPLDAAIIFSDILVLPDAMGAGLYFTPGEGPAFRQPVRSERDIANLGHIDPHTDLRYVMEAIQITKLALKGTTPLIGFCGSPWTVATYLVEGGSSQRFNHIKGLMYDNPRLLNDLLEKLTRNSIDYLLAQIESGADAIMIFDTWGGALSTEAYCQFSLPFMEKMVHALQEKFPHIPVILFTKGGGNWLEQMAQTGAQALGLDWTLDMAKARARVGEKVALQGNLDPAVLYASQEVIKTQVAQLLAQFGKGTGHIMNLGHGILPDILPEKVAALVEAVGEFSPAYHTKE